MGKQQNLIYILKDHSSCYVVSGKNGSSETSKETIAVEEARNDRGCLDWSVSSGNKEK